jgi:PAS domain-containing protein
MMAKLSNLMAVALAATRSGTFLWTIGNNSVSVDEDAADFFGFSPSSAAEGLPIERFLERVHPEDISRVAKSLHDAIVSGRPYQECYRVVVDDGSVHHLFARGHCFRGSDGVPAEYAGVIFDMTIYDDDDISQTIVNLCEAAQCFARQSQYISTGEFLDEVLVHLRSDSTIRKTASH